MKHSNKNSDAFRYVELIRPAGSVELTELFRAAIDQGFVRAVVLDLRNVETGPDSKLAVHYIEECVVPVIAVVSGEVKGWICDVIQTVHMCFAERETTFDFGKAGFLEKLVGKAFNSEANSQILTEPGAVRMGLINKRLDGCDALESAAIKAEKIAEMAPAAVRSCIEAVRESDTAKGYECELRLFAKLFGTEDVKRGTDAFFRKERAEFKGN